MLRPACVPASSLRSMPKNLYVWSQVAGESRATAQTAGEHGSLGAAGSAAGSEKKRKKGLPLAQDAIAAQTAATAAEVAPAEPETKRVRRATHVGRFKRREAGKRVRGYSADDLTAILGGQPQAGAAGADASAPAPAQVDRAASPETPSASEPPKPTSSDLPQPEGVWRQNAVKCKQRMHPLWTCSAVAKWMFPAVPAYAHQAHACTFHNQLLRLMPDLAVCQQTLSMLRCCGAGGSPEADAVSSEQQPDPAERRWWHGYFVRAGRLGGLRKVKKDTARVRLFLQKSLQWPSDVASMLLRLPV